MQPTPKQPPAPALATPPAPPTPAATPPAQPTITPTPSTVFFLPGTSTAVPGPTATPADPAPAATPPPAQPTPTPTAAATPTPTPADHIVETVAAATLPISTTHRSEYMACLRAARNPGKLAKGLIPAFAGGNQSERLDLFRLWLEKGKDFAQVEVEVNRRNIQSHTAKMKDMCMSRAQLEQDPRYKGRPQDTEGLIKSKTQSGDYIDDPNFPGREDLRQYIIHAETSKEDAHTRQDTQQVNSRTTVSATEAL